MNALLIGGTRNLGPGIVAALLAAGYRVTVLNRGLTAGELPAGVERLYADRSDADRLRSALRGRHFNLAVDTTLYRGPDATAVASILAGRVGRYIFLSSGQVYLVRQGLQRPFREEDYPGPMLPEPPAADAFNLENWRYGARKRDAEDALAAAHARDSFPCTILRLPMVNSELDHFDRIPAYVARLRDGGPILLPEGEHLPLRHVYGGDVVQAIVRLAATDIGFGRAYNISQHETLTIEEFLHLLGEILGARPRIVELPAEQLRLHDLIPDCSPFSDPWMSGLDNTLSVAELGMCYTSVRAALERIVRYHDARPTRDPLGYHRRPLELRLAART